MGEDAVGMLHDQMAGRINSWAIRFAFAHSLSRRMAVYPRLSMVRNIGFDGTGEFIALRMIGCVVL